ncbi:MAG: CvpA family protein [Nitrospinae bacterium]|nr:CvpA family protein [Nitrospinota bacterium]
MNIPLHWVDITIISILLVSFAFSCWRGFTKEIFSFSSYLISFLIANQFYGLVGSYLIKIMATDTISNITAFLLLFILTLITLLFTSRFVQERFMTISAVLSFNSRLVGGLIGVGKGIFFLIILFLLMQKFHETKNYIYNHSKYIKQIEIAASYLSGVTTQTPFLFVLNKEANNSVKSLKPQVRNMKKKTTKEAPPKQQTSQEEKAQKISNETKHEVNDSLTSQDSKELEKMLNKLE